MGGNCTPLADAGPDQEVTFGEGVTLDATASRGCDLEGVSTTFHWSFDSAPSASLLDGSAFSENESASARATTFVPDALGIYVLALEVWDDERGSERDVAIVEVYAGGDRPVAHCTGELEVVLGDLASFDGSQSHDPDGVAIGYAWALSSVPEESALDGGSVFQAGSAVASIVPDVPGTYTVHLVVSDGLQESEPTLCEVTAVLVNRAPVADAGQGEELTGCENPSIGLDAYGSYDPEGQPLGYLWGLVSAPEGSGASAEPCDSGLGCYQALDDPNSAGATFSWDLAGSYTLQLEVSDGEQWSPPDVVSYVVADCP